MRGPALDRGAVEILVDFGFRSLKRIDLARVWIDWSVHGLVHLTMNFRRGISRQSQRCETTLDPLEPSPGRRAKPSRQAPQGERYRDRGLHQPMTFPRSNGSVPGQINTDQLRGGIPGCGHSTWSRSTSSRTVRTPSASPTRARFRDRKPCDQHTEDPIKTIRNWLRILRPGGDFLVVPDRRRTLIEIDPDTGRAPASDYRFGPEGSRMEHYREWVQELEGCRGCQRESTRIDRAGIPPALSCLDT